MKVKELINLLKSKSDPEAEVKIISWIADYGKVIDVLSVVDCVYIECDYEYRMEKWRRNELSANRKNNYMENDDTDNNILFFEELPKNEKEESD